MSLTGNVSIRGFYSLGVKGDNFFADQRSRLSYTLMFQQKILDLWGVSYDACLVNPVSEYTRRTLRLETDYVYSLGMGMSLGAALNVNYTRAAGAQPGLFRRRGTVVCVRGVGAFGAV